MRYDHAIERVGDGILLMTRSMSSLPERLYDAFRCFNHLRKEEFPPDLQDEVEALRKEISGIASVGNDGRSVLIPGMMSDQRAREAIERLDYISGRPSLR